VADAMEFERIIKAGHEDDLKHLLDLSDSQLERYLAEIHEPKPEDYQIPEIDKIKTDIQTGDIYGLGKHRLMCGDATNHEDVLCLMNGQKADMVFTDPPYGIKILTKKGKIGFRGKSKPTIFAPIRGDDKPFNPSHLFDLAPKLVFFGANYYANKLPNSSCWLVWDKKALETQRLQFADCELLWTNIPKPSRIYRCVWRGFYREGEGNLTPRLHPAQKPLKLLTEVITDYTNNPDIILDPYGGSGSTLIACEQTGRHCHMMEIDARYCQVIINRWEKYTGQKAEKLVKNGENHVSKNNN